MKCLGYIRWISVLVLVGFCCCNWVSTTSLSDLGKKVGPGDTKFRPQRSSSGKELEKTGFRVRKCKGRGPMTKEVQILLSLVHEASVNATKYTKTTASFIAVLQSPSYVFRSTQLLFKELRHVLNSLRRHTDTNRVVQVCQQFQIWYDTVRTVVSRLRSVETQPVELWLRSVYLNMTEQSEAFKRLRTAVCNISASKDGKRLSNTLFDVSYEIKREMTQLDDDWKTNTEMLMNVSKVALNLDSIMSATRETAKEVSKLTRQLEIVKNVNKGFRNLKNFVDEHTMTPFSHQVYKLLASHVDGNWKREMRNLSLSTFLADLTTSQRLELDKIMECLKKHVLDLETATRHLPAAIYDSIGDNATETSPILDLIDKLAHFLNVIELKALPVSNAMSLTDNLVTKMQQAKDH